MAFNGGKQEGYIFGCGLDEASQVTVTPNPWSVIAVANGSHSIISVSLEKGQMGKKGATYHFASDVEVQEGHCLQTNVWVKDIFSVINDGYSSLIFFPAMDFARITRKNIVEIWRVGRIIPEKRK